MLCKLSVLALLLALAGISRSSEVNRKSDEALLNSEVLGKKLLPNVKHLLKEGGDGSRQKFLRLVDGLRIDGYKFVDGKVSHFPKYFREQSRIRAFFTHSIMTHGDSFSIRLISKSPRVFSRMQLTHFCVINNPKAPRAEKQNFLLIPKVVRSLILHSIDTTRECAVNERSCQTVAHHSFECEMTLSRQEFRQRAYE